MSSNQRRRLHDEFVKWGFDVRGWSPTTRRKYLTRVESADLWMRANRNIALVFAKPKDLQAYLFSTLPSARNRNQIRQSLVAFFNFLVDREYRDDQPASSLPRLPEPTYLPKALDFEATIRVVRAAKILGAEAEAMVLLLLFSGLRKTEARTLQWRNVDLDRGWVTFSGKGAKERTVPLHPDVLDALMRWRMKRNHPAWVFPSPRYESRAVGDTYVRLLVKEVGVEAGIPGLHPHLLRHTFATRLTELGADLRTVQEALGHANPKTTAIYTKVRPVRLKEAVEKLDFTQSAKQEDPVEE